MSAERTERATPKRRQEARKRGQVARSAELPSAAALLGAILVLRWYGGYAAETLGRQMQTLLGGVNGRDMTPLGLQQLGWQTGMTVLRVTGPLLAVTAVIAVGSTLAQSGLVFSATGLKPDFNRLNPAKGVKRIVSKRGAFEMVKSFVKLGVVAAVTYPLVRADIERFGSLTGSDPATIGRALTSALGALALRGGAAYFLLALLDYAFQRRQFENSIMMTRQELREEHKQAEGNPELKARIRRVQRQMGRRRMMSAVPSATVVLTNPTHLAVAIRFESSMAAPVVVAKGSGHVAERIKEIARRHGIVVMENKPLARALHQGTQVGAEIPVALYEAVADVIAYVYRLRGPREPGREG